jgi:hypothetical protein
MFTKSTIALAIIVGITSGALAATKQQNGTNSAWKVYDNRGHFIGADPDGLVRMQLRRDHGTTE